jgi:tryptophanyl-tRNA synthetase
MKIATDSKGVEESKNPDESNLFALHRLFASPADLQNLDKRYRDGGIGYKESKDILIDDMKKTITPLREKRKHIAQNKEGVLQMLKEGGEQARESVAKKMADVRKKTGVSY